MGTRGLIEVINSKGELKVAQYNHYDSYPSCLGADILTFLKCDGMIEHLRDRVDETNYSKISFLTKNESEEIRVLNLSPRIYTALVSNSWVDINLGAEILYRLAMLSGDVVLEDSSEFKEDTLMCEWYYLIDLQKNEFAVRNGPYEARCFHLSELPETEKFIGICETEVEL